MWVYNDLQCPHNFHSYVSEFYNEYLKDTPGDDYTNAFNQYFYDKSFRWKPNQNQFLNQVLLEDCFMLIEHSLDNIYYRRRFYSSSFTSGF